LLFEDKIQRVVLSTPQKIRRFIEPRVQAARGTSLASR
jgi:hypothetical protein